MSESILFACACQIIRAMARQDWFLSCGHIEVFGRIKSVEVCKNGLRLILSNGSKVWWAMAGRDAKTIANLVNMLSENNPVAARHLHGLDVQTTPPNAYQCGDGIEYERFYRTTKRSEIAYYSYHDDKNFWSRIESHENGYFDIRSSGKITDTCIDHVIWIV